MKENFAAFFRHGVEAVVNDSARVMGHFDNNYAEQLGMAGSQPQFTCASVDVSDVKRNDTLAIEDRAYRVQNVEPDGTGVTVLKLSVDK